jgi:hypothetical protein
LPGARTLTLRLGLAVTRTIGSGPTGPGVTLELPLHIAESLAGRLLCPEVAAEGDAGAQDAFTPAGTLAVAGLGGAPPPAASSGTVSAKPPDDDSGATRRLTEEQRQQRRRSNRSGLDDTRIEGDVVAVDTQARPPTITIASRDGEVTLRLQDDAREQADDVRVGDYVRAEGEKTTRACTTSRTWTSRNGRRADIGPEPRRASSTH